MKNPKDQKSEEVEKPKEADDFKDKYLRALADYQNLLRRFAREKEDFVKYSNEGLIVKLLSVLDNLERAKATLKNPGIDLIYNDLWKTLEKEGLEKIEIKSDEKFNPLFMECIEAQDGGSKLEEVRAGYKLKGKLIRAVQVKVVK